MEGMSEIMKKMSKNMRKIFSVIFVLAMVIGLLPMGTVEVKANENAGQGNISYEPLQLSKEFLNTSGGNGIATPTDYQTACFDPDEFSFYNKAYANNKGISKGWMPESGTIEVGGVPYQFADYEGKDCILLNARKTTETLVLETIGVYDKVYVLATGGGVGTSTSVPFNVTLNYTDGTTQDTTYYLKDWYPGSINTNTMYVDVQRIAAYGGGSADGSTTGGPVIQTSALDVDEKKLLESITFTYPDDDERLFCAVFGVTGATPPGVPDAPTAKAAAPGNDSSTVFVANWEVPKNQGLSNVSSYFIDIATDPNFTNILKDYNNKEVGNVTSYNVKSTANSVLDPDAVYYYRVRAKNDQGQSISSNRVATALPEWLGAAMDPADHSKVTFDLDTNTAIFDESVSLVDSIKVPSGEKVSIYVPENVTVTGAKDKPAISANDETTVSLTVYGAGTIKGGNGSDENVSDGSPAKPGQPAIDFSKATATLVLDSEKDGVTKIIGGNGGNSTTAKGEDGGVGIYLSGTSTMQEKGKPNIKGGNGGNGANDSKGETGIPVLREFGPSAIKATAYNAAYDGYTHKITVSAPSGATVTYSLTENGEYTTTNPTKTDVTNGPVTVYYKVEQEGYVPVTGSSTITITSRDASYLTISYDSIYLDYTRNEIEFPLRKVAFSGLTLEKGKDYEVVGDVKATDIGTYYVTIKGLNNFSGTKTITWYIDDWTGPVGEIRIDDEHKWSSTPQGYREIFFNKAQEITISATDAGIGLKEIEYMITDGLMLSDGSDEGSVWKTYQGPFTLEADGKYVIYARLTDKEDNSTIIMSDVIILDATAPVISGIENGKVYCDDEVKFTVEDEYLENVFINGEEAEADEEGYYIVTVGEDVQVIEAVDKSGNVTTYKITVNGCHTWKEPVVTWAEDELSATFDFVCMYDEEHTRTKEAQATLEIEDGATGSQKGTITHVVNVELDGKVYTAKQVNDTPVVEEEKIGDGKLIAKVEVAEDVPEVVVDNLNVNLVKDLLTEEQLESVETDGSQIEVSLKIETLKDAAPKSDVKLIKDTLATIVKDLTDKNNYVSTEEVKSGIEYIDLSLYMKIDDNPEEKISQLKGKELTITMEIPENIKSDKKGRQYYVIRVHDGAEVEVLDSVIDLEAGTIKFKTDRFSTYAIVYTDVTDAEVNVPEIPKTADSSNVELFVLTLVAGAYMVVCSGKKRSEV